MTTRPPTAPEPAFYTTVFQQNWENVRSIKSERMWFMNAYAAISAGTLTLLQMNRGQRLVQLALLSSMCLLSVMGLLISLRLKAELEECLQKLQAMVVHANAADWMALGMSEGSLSRYLPFRWMFPVFYSFAVALNAGLLVYRIVAGPP